jgi:hypothetical protein
VGDASLPVEYENGVADVLAFLAGDSAVVDRNVKLHGRHSLTTRQIDVRVRGRIFGMADAMLIADCKRWGKPVDVADAGTFVDLVEDVRADFGLLVTTEGASAAARERLRSARGTGLEVMTLRELAAWRPPGTFSTRYLIPESHRAAAERVLRRAGFRVMPDSDPRAAGGQVCLDVFRHYGTAAPSPEVQQAAQARAAEAMSSAGMPEPVILGSGIVGAGGTPGHRWLEVTVNGTPAGLKILAATEDEAAGELRRLSELLRVPGSVLDVIRPDGWPVPRMFGVPG